MEAVLLALAAVAAVAGLTWLVPGLLCPLGRAGLHLVYRFRVYGRNHLPDSGPTLIVCNHVSYIDWLVLCAASPRPPRFVLWAGYYRHPLLRFVLSWARHHTVRIDNRTARPHAVAESLKEAAAVLDRGELLVVFPEGRLTRNGQMLPFGRGIEHILKRSTREVPVIPACTGGLWGSVFSHEGGRGPWKLLRPFRRTVAVWFGAPLPTDTPTAAVRAAVAEAQADLGIRESDHVLPPPTWFVRTACRYRSLFRTAFVDVATGTEKRLSFAQGLVACWCLANWLDRRLTQPLPNPSPKRGGATDAAADTAPPVPAPPLRFGEGAGGKGLPSPPVPKRGGAADTAPPVPAPPLRFGEGAGGEGLPSPPVGVWLPTGLGSALANIALAFLRRPTVNLNYTAGPAAVEAAARQVGMRFVVTAKRFEAKVPLDLPADIERIYLEDALAGIRKPAKLLRFLAVLLLPGWLIARLLGLHRIRPDDVLTIIFSSGSTGEPKGVMLSHRNIGSNGHAFEVGVDIRPSDVMLSTLPFFHSFGYTVNLWAPVGIGCTAVFYPDPRAAKEVGELCARHRATIQMGTATFLRFYLRRGGADDFKSLRLLICGAEKLPVPLIHQFRDKFGVQPLEGYGCTEVSPVVSTSLPDVTVTGVAQTANVLGCVGQPIPGVAVKAFDPDTFAPLPPATDGLLGVKGPNVMLGYYGQPERTRNVVIGGWYMTGDMGRVEADGFIRITGRISRFAKLAGEMVPLEKVEEELQAALGAEDRLVVVCAVPDDKRGERLVVLHLPAAADGLEAALKSLPKRGLPNLWVPDRRDCYPLEAFPLLGSGKLDLRAVGELANRTAGVH